MRQRAGRARQNLYLQSTNREILDTSLVISTEETAKRIANGDAYVIRFKTQLVKPCICNIIRGDVKFETSLLDESVV
jgi:glutamyl-tRNA synthetase